jgi:KDO2-lipid IV(A) lauroyltransferase
MNVILYWLGRALIAFIQLVPLTGVAWLGRTGGGLAYHLDGRHRRVVLNNLTSIFKPEKTPAEIDAIARETFKRIGENYLSAVKTAAMSLDALRPHVEFTGLHNLPPVVQGKSQRNAVVAIGHFGNFELYARLGEAHGHNQCATTYRALKQPALDRLLQFVRGHSPCKFFERRAEGQALRVLMDQGGVILGLLADQSSKGMRAPFLGRDCNTGLAPAILALRYDAELSTAICYRIGLARWRLEFEPPIATYIDGHPRPTEDLMREVNLKLETAVRRDPANWFWVHRRWKD